MLTLLSAMAVAAGLAAVPIRVTLVGPAVERSAAPGSFTSRELERRASSAVELVVRAQALVRGARQAAGVPADPAAGPDPSGLVGEELTPLVTTLGSLEAKRVAVRPAWAAELTRQLVAHGVGPGSVVAASFSGSFPGLNLAVMAACEVLEVDLAAVSSVTASTWGANQPGFTWPEIEVRLVRAGALRRASIGVSAGGADDRAADLDREGRALAEALRDRTARELGVEAVRPESFAEMIASRLALFRRHAGGRPIALYVSVGGTDASLGRSTAILRLRSGFLPAQPFDRSPDRGLIARFAEDGVPVLMLLNVRELAARWGIRERGALIE